MNQFNKLCPLPKWCISGFKDVVMKWTECHSPPAHPVGEPESDTVNVPKRHKRCLFLKTDHK